MMERNEVFELMGALKLYGMRLAYDEVMSTGIKRQHEPPQIGGDPPTKLCFAACSRPRSPKSRLAPSNTR